MLEIGDDVRVTATVEMFYTDAKKRKALRSKVELVGKVCGATRRQLGVYCPGYSGFDEYEPAFLNVTGTIFVYQVRQGLMRKPVEVLPCDLHKVKK